MAKKKAASASPKPLATAEVVADPKVGATVHRLDALLAKHPRLLLLPALMTSSKPSAKACARFETHLRSEAKARGLIVARVGSYRDKDHDFYKPAVQEAFPWALVVLRADAEPPTQDAVLKAMAGRFCAWRARSQEQHLHVLGDESGLEEDNGVYALVVGRPGCGLPIFPFVHATSNKKMVGPVLEALAKALEAGRAAALIFEVPTLPQPIPVAGEADLRVPQQVFWDLMIPLVVEREMSRVAAKQVTIRVGVERADAIKAGSRATFLPHLLDLIRSRRPAWPEVSLGEAAVLAKGEHGWLGYPDVLANAYRYRGGLDKRAQAALERVLAHTVVLPFRERALRRVLDLLDDWAPHRAREFLANLARGLGAEDFDDYGLFLDAAIADAVGALSSPEWRDLCDSLARVLENEPLRQAGARRILRELTPKRIAGLPTAQDRAVAANARLHAANQAGERRVANQLVELWRSSIRSSPDVPAEARHRFVAHEANHLMNRFEFTQAARLLEKHLSEYDGQSPAPVLGSLLQCHGFTGEHDAFDALLPRYRERLGMASDTDLRLACYVAHAAIDRGRPRDAFRALTAGAGAGDDVASSLDLTASQLTRATHASPFFHVALLKTLFAIFWEDRRCPPGAAAHVPAPEDLPSGHPGEALAFWGAYVASASLGKAAGAKLAAALVERASALHKPRDLIGVRLAAYWESLAVADIVAGGTELAAFKAGILDRSTASTRAWCARPPADCTGWAARYPESPGLVSLLPLTFLNL